MSVYQQLEQEAKPKRLVDHTARWEKLEPLASVNGQVEAQVKLFCERKRITPQALATLEPRLRVRQNGGVDLAFAGRSGAGRVVAIKYRPPGGSSHDSTAEQPSTWLQPIVLGNLSSLDWFLAEGETDAARLWELVGEGAAIMVLPAGARTFKRQWAERIPRGATVALCHDADEDGDAGAEKAAKIIGGKTIRVRPPLEGGDWCDWDGGLDDFLELLNPSRHPRFEFTSLTDFLSYPYPKAEPLLGKRGAIFIALGSLILVYGADGSGKSTWTIDGIAHLGAGVDWLGITVPRSVRICIIENEGPPLLFQQKLEAKIASWDGPDFTSNVFTLTSPWGEFSFADAQAREELVSFCEEYDIDIVTANPTLGLGVAASGRPDETQQFVDWLVECGLKSDRAFWLLHHENKAGQISGDWGRHPDTKVQLQQDGNEPRTRLDWAKTRWATLPTEAIPKVCMLEWVVETQGYTVTEMDTQGASDSELHGRIVDFLRERPLSSTTTVCEGVQGTNRRIQIMLAESDDFDCAPGPRGAKLWFLPSSPADPVAAADTEPTR